MTDIITRTEAKERGLKHYFTGEPCSRNHISERRVDSSNCNECTLLKNKTISENRAEKRNNNQRSLQELHDREIIPWTTAKNLGLKTYFSGKSCAVGHVTERYTSGRSCLECCEIKRRAYLENNWEKELERSRKWKRENREKVLEANRRRDNSEKRKQQKKTWCRENLQRLKNLRKTNYLQNKARDLKRNNEWARRNRAYAVLILEPIA